MNLNFKKALYNFRYYLPVLERLCYTNNNFGVWESKEATSTTTLTLINEYFELYLQDIQPGIPQVTLV